MGWVGGWGVDLCGYRRAVPSQDVLSSDSTWYPAPRPQSSLQPFRPHNNFQPPPAKAPPSGSDDWLWSGVEADCLTVNRLSVWPR